MGKMGMLICHLTGVDVEFHPADPENLKMFSSHVYGHSLKHNLYH